MHKHKSNNPPRMTGRERRMDLDQRLLAIWVHLSRHEISPGQAAERLKTLAAEYAEFAKKWLADF